MSLAVCDYQTPRAAPPRPPLGHAPLAHPTAMSASMAQAVFTTWERSPGSWE